MGTLLLALAAILALAVYMGATGVGDLIAAFAVPPLASHAYGTARAVNPKDPTTWGKVGRNDPCPCGSGKKYKHCHGRFG